MIKTKTPINFLRHIFHNSITDLANITVAEGEDKYDIIIGYLTMLRKYIDNWIRELEKEEQKKNEDKTI